MFINFISATKKQISKYWVATSSGFSTTISSFLTRNLGKRITVFFFTDYIRLAWLCRRQPQLRQNSSYIQEEIPLSFVWQNMLYNMNEAQFIDRDLECVAFEKDLDHISDRSHVLQLKPISCIQQLQRLLPIFSIRATDFFYKIIQKNNYSCCKDNTRFSAHLDSTNITLACF